MDHDDPRFVPGRELPAAGTLLLGLACVAILLAGVAPLVGPVGTGLLIGFSPSLILGVHVAVVMAHQALSTPARARRREAVLTERSS